MYLVMQFVKFFFFILILFFNKCCIDERAGIEDQTRDFSTNNLFRKTLVLSKCSIDQLVITGVTRSYPRKPSAYFEYLVPLPLPWVLFSLWGSVQFS